MDPMVVQKIVYWHEKIFGDAKCSKSHDMDYTK